MHEISQWKKKFWTNVFSNYLRLFFRLLFGFITFRLLYENFSHEELGVYYLFWSLIGYTILFDFGMGFTLQKMVAEKMALNDPKGINQIAATVFWSFTVIGILIFSILFFLQDTILTLIDININNLEKYRFTLLLFSIALMASFPLGIFQEILSGLHRFSLINLISILNSAASFCFIIYFLFYKFSFNFIVFSTLLFTVSNYFFYLIFSYRLIPGFSLKITNFNISSVTEVLSFSLVAYLISFSNLLILRSDNLIVSLTLGVSVVAIYQVGLKISEVFNSLTNQLQSLLSPAASQLNALMDKNGIKLLLIRTTQIVIYFVTPLYLIVVIHMETLIKILTGWKQISSESFWIGQLLLLSTYSTLLTNSCSFRIMMMCGKERKLLKFTLLNMASNLILSIVLVKWIGMLGVAIGTMAPTIIIGWLIIVPFTANFLNLKSSEFLFQCIQPILLPLLCVMATLWISINIIPLNEGLYLGLFLRSFIVLIALLIAGANYLKTLKKIVEEPSA